MTPPQRISHYRITAYLGSGLHTQVYQATDTVRKRTVALKVLKPTQDRGRESLSRYLDQGGLAAELIHPHIAWVWETGEDGGHYYLAERFINGPSLAKVLAEIGPLSWEAALQITQQISQALDYAHSRGWVHGDIKPGNILLSPDLGAVLTDFGLLRALQAIQPAPVARNPLGTLPYIPPEVWRGSKITPVADQYALACVLAEMLTGQPLFDGATPTELEAKHLAPLSLPQIWPPGTPLNINTTLERALSQDPAGRFPSAGAFVDKLAPLSATSDPDPEERAVREASLIAWRQAQEQARLNAEEAERLAALEQARREIDEQLQREKEAGVLQSPGDNNTLETIDTGSKPRLRRKERPVSKRYSWLIWAGSLMLALVLAGLWLNTRIPGGVLLPDTPTATDPPPTAFYTATRTTTPTATKTTTPTETASPTPIATLTRTPTPTATYTPTPTITPTPTSPPTPTRERIDSDAIIDKP